MSHICRESIDFEQWSRMARQDPEGFEALRLEMIEEVIEAASGRCQRRLRGLQWQIDQMRERSANPMAACIALSKMMWEAFAGEDGLVQTLNREAPLERPVVSGAKILPFPPP